MLGGANSCDPVREEMMTTSPMTVRMFAHARYGDIIRENHDMHMAARTMRWTRAHLHRLPDDGNRYEIVRGDLFVTPAPSTRHQALVFVIAGHLRRYIEPLGLGQVQQAPSAMVFEGSEVQPDLAIIPPALPPPATWEEMPRPFLVVEVLSDMTRQRDLVAKRALYLDAGVAEYWIVDGDRRSIRVVRQDSEQLLVERLEWHPSGATERLVIDVASLFREALG